GIAHASYTSDYRGLIAAFSWKPGNTSSQWSDLHSNPFNAGPPGSIVFGRGQAENAAAIKQALDIVRRLTGNQTIKEPTFDGSTWTPFAFYNHLVMNDYLAHRLPEPTMVCPEDASRLQWAKYVQQNPNSYVGAPPANLTELSNTKALNN